MKQIKVSIIVPIYKVPERYLKKCIESIQEQTYKNIEIILVDDGSPDKCGEICDTYANSDSRIKVIHKKNAGLSAARNTGFEATTGEWFMFVDGDDWIEENMCELMISTAIKNNVQLVMSGVYKDYPNYTRTYKYSLQDNKVYEKEECKELQSLLLDFNGNIACAYAKLINKEFAINHNIQHDEVLRQGAEGIEYNLRLFNYLTRAIFINVPLYHYIYNEDSISVKCDNKNNYYVLNCFEKIKSTILKSNNKELLLGKFYNRLVYVIITTAISGYFNPTKKIPYSQRVREYRAYLSHPLVKEAIKECNLKGVSLSRKITFMLIKMKLFHLVYIVACIRKKQLVR